MRQSMQRTEKSKAGIYKQYQYFCRIFLWYHHKLEIQTGGSTDADLYTDD